MKRFLFSALFSCFFASSVLGKVLMIDGVPVEIGNVAFNGTGCPPNSVVVTASSDNKNVVVLFDSYSARTNSRNPVDQVDCSLALPIKVGAGLSVGVLDVDWRGTVVNGENSFVNFHREYFFSGSANPSFDNNWTEAGFENFRISDSPAFVRSSCDGDPLIARVDTAATVAGANGLFSLRSLDAQSRLILNLDIRSCS